MTSARSALEVFSPVTRPADLRRARIEASADLPSQFGNFRVHVFSSDFDDKEHLALVKGDVSGAHDVLTRLHSECLTGDVLGSLRCDCRGQLERALSRIEQEPRGVVLYLRQEGRGIGLTNKIRAYQLQQRGYDTVDANLALGFAEDEREYGVAAAMLAALGVQSVALMTNNPDKLEKLTRGGVLITRRIPHEIAPNSHNRYYLQTKARRSGHLLETAAVESDAAPSPPRATPCR